MLLLESLYNLSEVKVSHECADRISFRKFLGLSFESPVPDDSTLVRFRDRLRRQNLHQVIEKTILATIHRKGIRVKTGSIIDATLIEAATRPDSKSKDSVPESSPSDTHVQADSEKPRQYKESEASHTVKRGKAVFGWKLHIARALRLGLIENWKVTKASVHESQVFTELLKGDEPRVLADKGYVSKAHREWLAERGICDMIMIKMRKGFDTLNEMNVFWNGEISRYRSEVENSFANLKRWRGLGRARYLGQEKMTEQTAWSIAAHNLLIATKWLP